MAKVSICLVFAILVVALPFHSVLCAEDPWQSVIDEAKNSGVSQDTLSEAEKALEDGTAEQVAAEAIGDGSSLAGWVQQANDETSKGSSPAEAPTADSSDEVEENSPVDAPGLAPKSAAPVEAPELAPTNTNAAPQKAPTSAPTGSPSQAPQPQAA